ncbi:MAG: VOC family protein, partial [Sphingomonadales bacterium]
ELKPRLIGLNDGDVHGPVDQMYGQRELMIVAPDGNLLVFGQDIAIKRD